MLSHVQPLKRRRSPSPTGYDHQHDSAFTSPLDVLIKRRRRNQTSGYFDGNHGDGNHNNNDDDDDDEEMGMVQHEQGAAAATAATSTSVSASTPYVDKRRTRQWDRLNAGARPSLPANGNGYSQPHLEFTPPHPSTFTRAHSFPTNGHASASGSSPHAFSQPLPQHQMSSSPVRHQVYGSSPFKATASNDLAAPYADMSSDAATRVDESPANHHQPHQQQQQHSDEEMDPEEMRRGWGEQYAQQNELLHSLHRQRMSNQYHQQQQHQRRHSQSSPDPSLLQTPQQYRDSYFGSSPWDPPSSVRTHRSADSSMFVEVEAQTPPEFRTDQHPDAAARYEEANRLLAELEVVRRHRWGH